MNLKTTQVVRARLIMLAAVGILLLSACSSAAVQDDQASVDAAQETTSDDSDGSNFGPTPDELNTIAVAERFGPSTAALTVTVGGQQMLSLIHI